MTVRDARGVEIKPGDVAVYVSGGRYTHRFVVRVAEIKRRVRLDRVDRLGRPFVDEDPHGREWVDGGSLFVVDQLPHAEGRLNAVHFGRVVDGG